MVIQSDISLTSFLNSVSPIQAENALAALLAEQIEPTINKTLRSKLHVSLKESDFTQTNQDALEIASDVKLILISELKRLKSESGGKPIHNLNGFVTSVTINAYRQYLRAKYPLRQQLKNKLRYLLTHHESFALWEEEQNNWVSGFKEWLNQNAQTKSFNEEATLTGIAEIARFKNMTAAAQTIDLLIFIFDFVRAPIHFNELVSIVAEIQGVKDQKELSENEFVQSERERIMFSVDKSATAFEQQDYLRKIWAEIGELPVRHRVALLLNLKDKEGDCLVWLFPILRIASIKQIAKMLEFPFEEFAVVWRELPWEDTRIAEHLSLTRQQVINLRQSSRSRLVRLFAAK